MNRRDFLKLLGVTTAAATLPVGALPAAAESISVAVDDAVIDAPVTNDLPVGYIEIDGHRISFGRGININYNYQRRMGYFGSIQEPAPPRTVDIEFTTKDSVHGITPFYFGGELKSFRVNVPGYGGHITGKCYISDMNICASSHVGTETTMRIVVPDGLVLA